MSNEYFPVILDIGSRFVKGGFVGESHPIATSITSAASAFSIINTSDIEILSSELKANDDFGSNTPPFLGICDKSLSSEQTQLLMTSLRSSHPTLLKLCRIYQRDLSLHKWTAIHTDLGHDDTNDTNSAVVNGILRDIIGDHLLISPKRCKIIVIDNHESNHLNYLICKNLLFNLKVKSVILLPESLMTLFGANLRSGLVINLGWNQCSIDSIFDLRLLEEMSLQEIRGFNGNTLHYKIVECLIDLNDEKINTSLLARVDLFDIIESFIVNGVYVRSLSEETKTNDSTFEIMPGVTIPGHLRYEVIESMFFAPIEVGRESMIQSGEGNLPATLMNLITKKIAVDIRPQLLTNIVFDGGISRIAGFKSRVLQELRKIDQSEKSVNIKAKITLGSWTGTSLYCSSSLLRQSQKVIRNQEITRDVIHEINNRNQGVNLAAFPSSWNSLYKHT